MTVMVNRVDLFDCQVRCVYFHHNNHHNNHHHHPQPVHITPYHFVPDPSLLHDLPADKRPIEEEEEEGEQEEEGEKHHVNGTPKGPKHSQRCVAVVRVPPTKKQLQLCKQTQVRRRYLVG